MKNDEKNNNEDQNTDREENNGPLDVLPPELLADNFRRSLEGVRLELLGFVYASKLTPCSNSAHLESTF